MIYQMPTGIQIDLARVRRISSVRDFGQDNTSIDKCRLGFTIHLEGRETIEVTDYYHYSDWAEIKRKMCNLRKDIFEKWEAQNNAG